MLSCDGGNRCAEGEVVGEGEGFAGFGDGLGEGVGGGGEARQRG